MTLSLSVPMLRGICKDDARIRYTCQKYKRLTKNTTYFCDSVCTPRPFCRGNHWLTLRQTQPDTVLPTILAWKWGRKQTLEMQHRAENPPQKGVFQIPKLPPLQKCSWWRDLTEEGVEPQPGPAGRILAGISLNGFGRHHVACLRDLPVRSPAGDGFSGSEHVLLRRHSVRCGSQPCRMAVLLHLGRPLCT